MRVTSRIVSTESPGAPESAAVPAPSGPALGAVAQAAAASERAAALQKRSMGKGMVLG